MPDILLNRETVILTAPSDALFPRNDLYPADDLYPYGEVREVTNIVAGSLKLDSLLAEKSIQFGQFYATKFEVQVYNEEDLSGGYIHVYQREGNVYHDLFTGVIDSCKVDKIGTDRTIVAYDKAYVTRQMNVADFWNSYWTIEGQTATLKQVRDALLGYYGIPYEDVTLPNDDLVVSKNVDFTSCSLQQLLGSICELNCCLPHFNGNGYLEFIMLDTEATPVDISGKYEWMNSDFQDYVTAPISGIQFFDSDDQLKLTYVSADNAYPIKKNVFLYNADDATLNSVASTMMNYLQDLVYTPASLKMIVGSFDLHLGDYVHTEKGNFYILQNSYSGSQFVEQTIKAEGDEQSYGGTEDLDYGEIILNQKYARVSKDLENFIAEYGKEQTATTTKIDGIFANYTSDDAVDYAPSVSSPPASTWVNPDTRASHIGELFYDTVNKKYYEWQKTSDTPTYNWIQVPSYAHNYSMVSSRFQLNEDAISTEVRRATREESRIEEDNYEAFANYVGTGAPTQSWSGDTRLAHAGEIYYDKTAKKYYVYTLTYNTDGSIKTAGWVQKTINKKYDLVTTTSNSKMEQTSTSFSVAINTEAQTRHEEDALSFTNYVGNGAPTQSWSGNTRFDHAGDVYYDKQSGKYYMYTLTYNADGTIKTAEWKETVISKRYDLVTKTASAKMELTDTEFSVALNTERNERHSETAKSFCNYSSKSSNTSDAPARAVSGSDNWSASTKKANAGKIYYNETTGHYWRWVVEVNSEGSITKAEWKDEGEVTNRYNLVTETTDSKLSLTSNQFSVSLNSEISARKNEDLKLTYSYTGTSAPSSSYKPWPNTDSDRDHVGEIYYDSTNKEYYVYEKTGTNTYAWTQRTMSTPFSSTTRSNSAMLNLAEDEFSVTLEKSERALFANYTGEVTGSLPGKPWSDADINHVGQVYYGTNNEKYYKFQLVNNVYKWVEFSNSSVPYNVVSSQIKQTTDAVELKVNKTDVVNDLNSRLRISTDSILLETAGKLIITSGNFTIDNNGNVNIKQGSFTIENPNYNSLIIDANYPSADIEYLFEVGSTGFGWHSINSYLETSGHLWAQSAELNNVQITGGTINIIDNTNYREVDLNSGVISFYKSKKNSSTMQLVGSIVGVEDDESPTANIGSLRINGEKAVTVNVNGYTSKFTKSGALTIKGKYSGAGFSSVDIGDDVYVVNNGIKTISWGSHSITVINGIVISMS